MDNDVHIWDEWAYKRYMQYWDKNGCSITHEGAKIGMDIGARSHRPFTQIEFINNIKGHAEFAIQFGELGEGTYGGMWRAFPYSYEAPEFEYGAQKGSEIKTGQVDQLQKVIDKLKTNPDDRRLIVSAWHPYWVDHCALPPCHCLFHFNTEELTLDERKRLLHEYHWPKDKFPDKIFAGNGIKAECDDANIPTRRLNCLLYQRSNDTALGIPFNITSYALLTAMVAQCVGMVPGIFTHSHGDLHIYQNHVVGLKEQMTRLPRKLPSLWINPKVKNLFDFKYDDIKLVGYDPHPTIKFDVAV